MANDSRKRYDDAESETSSPALLALKRLIRGTLQPIGIAIISLTFVLNLTGQPANHKQPVRVTHRTQTSQESQAAISGSVPGSISVPGVSLNTPVNAPALSKQSPHTHPPHTELSDQEGPEKSAQKPYQLLRPMLTHHRLTTSRLALPATTKHMVANLADAE